MPSLEHNGFVALFREDPDLAPHFLATLFHQEVPPYTSVSVVETAPDQPLLPVELSADLLLVLRGWSGSPVLAIILEVQRDKNPEKKLSWLLKVAIVRARTRCPTIMLVVAPDTDVAAWAVEPIDIGLSRGSFSPLVLGAAILPGVLLQLLERRGIALSDTDRDRVNDCTDLAQLDRWVDNLLGAKTAADVLT